MTAETERQAIRDLWPAHVPHLVPEDNRMGQPYTDTEHGIVCNCGDVLGWPEDAPQPAEIVEEVVEHRYDAADDQSAMVVGGTEDAAQPAGYDGPPRPGDGEVYVDPSGTEWKSTSDHPHPDDPRFKYYAQEGEPPEDPWGGSHREGSDIPDEVVGPHYELPMPAVAADEAQTAMAGRPVQDVQLPAVGAEQIRQAGDALASGDREGFHRALEPSGIPERPRDVVPAEDPLAKQITVIDPTLPYGPEQVEFQLLSINNGLERGVHYQRAWEERLYQAKIAFNIANARALVNATGGDAATRKAQALLACEAEYLELELCECMVKAVRETMHNLRSLQSGYQTINNSVRDQYRGPQGQGR